MTPDSSLCRAAAPRLCPLQLLIAACVRFETYESAAAPWPDCIRFICCFPSLRPLLPDCARFSCCLRWPIGAFRCGTAADIERPTAAAVKWKRPTAAAVKWKRPTSSGRQASGRHPAADIERPTSKRPTSSGRSKVGRGNSGHGVIRATSTSGQR